MYQEDIEAREKFLSVLAWLLSVAKRYPAFSQFGLAHIRYENPRMLGEAYGAQGASRQLDEVSHSLRRAFRKTDLVARDGSDFWILVPYAPAEEKLVDKIKYIMDTAAQSGLRIVERDISIFALPQEVLKTGKDYSAPELLAYLKENRNSLARHEIMMPASAIT